MATATALITFRYRGRLMVFLSEHSDKVNTSEATGNMQAAVANMRHEYIVQTLPYPEASRG